jgi:hypothetical protein
MSERLRVDPAELTLGELSDVTELLGEPLDTVMAKNQAKGLLAVVCIIKRRTEPEFSLEDARALRITDLELPTNPEALGANNGAPLPESAELGQ